MYGSFTTEHFELLDQWKGQKRDESNGKQNYAYEELKNAYEITELWAKKVQIKLFHEGKVKIRKRPTSQGNFFLGYNWARIYPTNKSPKQLAYTVGIEDNAGFVVKIDTIGLNDNDPIRHNYFSIRGQYNNSSPIIAMLSKSQGLSKSFDELVDWSIEAIQKFSLTYDELISKLNLRVELKNDEDQFVGEGIITQPFNRIYYGPPGTGKTYQVSKLLKQDYEVQMTAVSREEWKAQFIEEKVAPLKWWEGVVLTLLDLGGKANVSELLEHPFIKSIVSTKGRKANLRQTLWTTLQERTIDDSSTVKQKSRFSPQVFDKDEESFWRLAGEWKEVCADLVTLIDAYRKDITQSIEIIRHHSFVTFHQSYGYEEFVEGLRPVLDDNESGAVKYEIKSGVFKELCRKAKLLPNQRFAMVIDEINRGNISKIFGELITLIEPDKREGQENEISVILPYSGELFSVPSNVDIIGTMNTADRSLALLDTALRRRFEFESVYPDVRDEVNAPLYGLQVVVDEQVINISQMLFAINQRIEALYDRDHCIGHAYFTPLIKLPDGNEKLKALSLIFKNRIIPLLEEYFFEDWQKIRLVLADNQKADEDQFIIESQDHEENLTNLFGSNHGMSSYDIKPCYVLQDSSFLNPNAYISIYQTLLN
ncbi:restriction endonuclease [Acinetobacter baumannii]|uniref:McrB family protein n=1 Tax=Acinetobacter baumannii TaxID=470 RepID=UPI00092C4CB8|nr:AAA family ATPase [Acinetobacter baumannii]OJK06373.1 restriction endonuclease [Acinetobacter baumannii]